MFCNTNIKVGKLSNSTDKKTLYDHCIYKASILNPSSLTNFIVLWIQNTKLKGILLLRTYASFFVQ